MPVKPSESEEKYFQELELQRKLQKQLEDQQKRSADEMQRQKELHWMFCPKCGHKLATEKLGQVEIDLCPSCKGLWLDANELDTIIQNSSKTKVFSSFLGILKRT